MKYTKKCVLDIETTSFIPWNDGRIICIGIKDVKSGETIVFFDEDEKTLLMRFLKYFERKKFQKIIGFNTGFDARFIFVRCLRHKISANGFFKSDFVDLMEILHKFKRAYAFDRPGTLDEWARFLLGKGKLLKNNSIPALFKQGCLDEIIRYNKNDVELTFELWKKIMLVLHGD